MTGPTADPPQSTLRYDNVLVALDGSDEATAALGTARALAARFDAPLHTISVASSANELTDLRDRAAAAIGADGDVQHIHTCVDAAPATAISTLAAELGRCLVCMTTQGHGRIIGALIGSTARSVIHDHRRPIIVLGPLAGRRHYFDREPREPLVPSRIVVCVDGTNPTDQGVAVATAWAQALAMPMTILTVQEPSISTTDTNTVAVRLVLEQLSDSVAAQSIDVDTCIHHGPIGVADGVKTHLTQHPAAIVVVSTRALSGMRRFTGGATAATIAAAVNVATLLVPTAS